MDRSKYEPGISTVEAARLLGINVQTVRKWIWRGRLPAVSVPSSRGFRWRVLVDEDWSSSADFHPLLDDGSSGEGGWLERDFGLVGTSAPAETSAPADRQDRLAVLLRELERVESRLGRAREELISIDRQANLSSGALPRSGRSPSSPVLWSADRRVTGAGAHVR